MPWATRPWSATLTRPPCVLARALPPPAALAPAIPSRRSSGSLLGRLLRASLQACRERRAAGEVRLAGIALWREPLRLPDHLGAKPRFQLAGGPSREGV